MTVPPPTNDRRALTTITVPRVHALLFSGLLLWGGVLPWTGTLKAAEPPTHGPDFTREVRPILSRHCFKCHGPDDLARKGGLRLDVREDAMRAGKSGAIAIVPGDNARSEFIKRIETEDADDLMPPPEAKMPLSVEQKAVLKRWIQSGAEYQLHWAFEGPHKPEPPAVNGSAWPRNTLDQFILARLNKAGITPAPAADATTLVRRLYLDLIGIGPLPTEVAAFEEAYAKNPDKAVEQTVDELLASPRYGERWARRWLDLARYADTNGYEKDRDRSVWPYRDWVVRALNADMPFDQFTLWQIAGDRLTPADLPPGTSPLDPLIATGFHRNTMLNEEGGIDPLEFRFHAMTDRVATTGTAWLGLTLQCAQCHTHKYDPIPHREYYQIMACLNNADEPDLDLPDAALAERHQENLTKIPALLDSLETRWPVADVNIQWQTPKPVSVTLSGGQNGQLLDDGSVLFPVPSPDKQTQTFVIETRQTNLTHLRLEALTDDSLPNKGPGRIAHGNFVLTEVRLTAVPLGASTNLPAQPVRIASATANAEQTDYPVKAAFDGKSDTGWGAHANDRPLNERREAVFRFEKPLTMEGGVRLTVVLEQNLGGQHTLGRVRLSTGAADEKDPDIPRQRSLGFQKAYRDWLEKQRQSVVAWTVLRPSGMTSNLPLLHQKEDGSILASGDISKSDTYTLSFAALPKGATALRLEAQPDPSLPAHGPGMTYYEGPKGDFFLGEFEVWVNGRKLELTGATESYSRNNFGSHAEAALAIDGDPQTGWSCAGRTGAPSEAVFRFKEPLSEATTAEIRLRFGRHYACSLGRFRVSTTLDTKPAVASGMEESAQALLAVDEAVLTPDQRRRLKEAFLQAAPELAAVRTELETLRRPPAYTTTLVLRERPADQPRPTFLHKRGEYLQPTDLVKPGALAAINRATMPAPVDRLSFARWLVHRDNPLTARVNVNRAWQAFFGRGLVRTTDDFGLQGDTPSHPELLDWLAMEFMDQGWSMKRLHKWIATSATYRMGSVPDAGTSARLATVDPENRLLHRFPRTRLEAEVLRDSILRVAGLLSYRMGGPGVRPPQPDGITEAAYGQPKWNASAGEDRHRRSVYTYLKRTAPFAFFNTFDAPSGEACIARRDTANTPLQALTVLNDVLMVEASQALGRQFAGDKQPDSDRLTRLFRRCLARPPTAQELQELNGFLAKQRQRFQSGELDAAKVSGDSGDGAVERAAWTTLARVLLNVDEFVTKG